MARPGYQSKAESFNFRVNAALKAAFTAATAAESPLGRDIGLSSRVLPPEIVRMGGSYGHSH